MLAHVDMNVFKKVARINDGYTWVYRENIRDYTAGIFELIIFKLEKNKNNEKNN